MQNLKYDTNELIQKTETDSQTWRTDFWLPSGRDGQGVWDQQMQTIIYRMDKQQVLLYSTGDYIQYPVINHNGKNMKNNVYICITESLCSVAEINTV